MIAASMMFAFCACKNSSRQEAQTAKAQSGENAADAVLEMSGELFTDRDYDFSYAESSAVKILLENEISSSDSERVEIQGNSVTVKASGVYIISGSLENGQIVVDTDDTEKVQLVLSNAQINCDTSAAIYIKAAAKTFITLAEGTSNTLSNKDDFIAIDDNNIDSVIFSKEDITFNGSGSLEINAAYGHTIVSKKDMKFTGGVYSLNAKEHCLQAKNSIRIAGGTFNLNAQEDALHCKYEDDNSNTKGFVYISGGELRISAGDDALHTTRALVITGGTVNISQCSEGLEGEALNISGGDITIKSSDDGINAASGSSETDSGNPFASDGTSSVEISGGTIKIDSEGDGIDSNGDIIVTGGEIYIDGPENSGNGALDYGGTAEISGGTVVAVGDIGMAQNFSGGTQCSMLIGAQGAAGSELLLKNSSGETLLSYTAAKSFGSVLISCSALEKGENYILTCNGQETEITMSDTIYSSTGQNAMGGTGRGGENKRPNEGDFRPGGNPPNGDEIPGGEKAVRGLR